ncbi:MAG TPA: GMC family oxidoreductase [Rhizomicrobium sp.]|nr:GMC family oxidoreductase [Rhizomicrobium sp.]
MTSFLDARALPKDTVLTPDLAIIGGGPAGISLALAFADSGQNVLLLESGGLNFETPTQSLYQGSETGVPYVPLDGGRLRYLGGSTNHWGGWCRPLDEIDFESRDEVPHSGWPFTRKEIEPYFTRAQALVEAGPWIYDAADKQASDSGPVIKLGEGGIYTSWFQFSKTRNGILPTHFGERYQDDLKRARRVTPLLNANVAAIRLSHDAAKVDHLDVATLSGNRLTVTPRYVVLAAGAMENARLLLASNDVMNVGIGNGNDLVGRFFADHPIPRNVATLVLFDGRCAPFYANFLTLPNGAVMRAALSPKAKFLRDHGVVGSLTTVENDVKLDPFATAAIETTAEALGVDASRAKAFSLGCGMEPLPDPDRRVTLSQGRDALGLPRLNLNMTITDSDFARFRITLAELGRQLLAAKSGMIHLSYNSRAEWLKAMDWGNHHMGTTRMHDDPEKGVVDGDAKVHGVGNLYVAGASVFPTYGSSNPTMNLLALTLRLGDHLRQVMA